METSKLHAKLELLAEMASVGVDYRVSAIFNALAACLSPEEVCEAFDVQFQQTYLLRRALIKQILMHMSQGVHSCHFELMDSVRRALVDLPAPKLKSATKLLLQMAQATGEGYEADLMEQLSTVSNSNIRGQVYRMLKQTPDYGCPEYVAVALQLYGDFEAARLLVMRATIEELTVYFGEVENALAGSGYWIARLYLRFAGHAPADLERLRQIDSISHAYVCAKLGVKLPPDEMVELYRMNVYDQRAGLIAWSSGQMGQWQALTEMLQFAHDPPAEAIERFLRKRGGSRGEAVDSDRS